MGKDRSDSHNEPRGLKISWYTLLVALLFVAVVVEALSAIEWAVYPYFPDKSLLFAKTDAAIFSALAPFSPAFLIVLLYVWVVRLAASLENKFSKRLKAYLNRITESLSTLRPKIPSDSVHRFTFTDRPRLLLVLAMVMGIFLGLVPYRPKLNPAMSPVGVDAHFYVEWVNEMLRRTPLGAVYYAMGSASFGSRPLLLLPMYLAVVAGWLTTIQAVELLPAILCPLVALSTFLFVREGQQNEKTAGVVSLFSVFSFNTTLGLWAGFYANWLAIAEVLLFLAVLLSFLRKTSRSKLLAMILASLSMLLTHPWTGAIVLFVAALLVLSVRRAYPATVHLKPIVLMFAIVGSIYAILSVFVEGLAAAQITLSSLAASGISQPLSFWPNLINGLFVFGGGVLGNALLLGFSLIAMLYLGFRDKFQRLLTLWMALGSLLLPFFGGGGQARILYDLPFPILTSMGLLFLIRPIGNRTLHSNLALLLVLLLSANYALSVATELVAVPF